MMLGISEDGRKYEQYTILNLCFDFMVLIYHFYRRISYMQV